MTDFSVFMAGNVAKKDEIIEYAASKRIGKPELDEKGKPTGNIIPELWKLKAVDNSLDEAIRKECTKKIPIVGKRGQYNQEVDTDKYIGKLCVACTVYPDLNNAELQDSYGVKSADELLKKILLPGEYTEFKNKIMEVNGFDIGMDELVDDAKN